MNQYDVIIIGGSYAGLSAATILGRSLRKVLVLDGGNPCNKQTPHSHSYLTRDGETPANIAAIALDQLKTYKTVAVKQAFVTDVTKIEDGFNVVTQNNEVYKSRKLLLATGMKDIIPEIEGFKECWGISILHCPYCHGYEVRNQKTALFANGDNAFELSKLIQNWSKDLLLCTNGPSTLTPEQLTVVQKLGIEILETEVEGVTHINGQLQEIKFKDGTSRKVTAMYARFPFIQHSNFAEQLGCAMTESGHIQVNEFGVTNVPGVFAAGDNTSLMRQVAVAAANGGKAGAWINREMIEEDLS